MVPNLLEVLHLNLYVPGMVHDVDAVVTTTRRPCRYLLQRSGIQPKLVGLKDGGRQSNQLWLLLAALAKAQPKGVEAAVLARTHELAVATMSVGMAVFYPSDAKRIEFLNGLLTRFASSTAGGGVGDAEPLETWELGVLEACVGWLAGWLAGWPLCYGACAASRPARGLCLQRRACCVLGWLRSPSCVRVGSDVFVCTVFVCTVLGLPGMTGASSGTSHRSATWRGS